MKKLLSALVEHARTTPAKPALLFGKQGAWTQLSYADLLDETERWAAIFTRERLEPGGVVFIVLDHRLELYGAFLGAMRAGMVPSFLAYPTPKQDAQLYWRSHASLFERVRPACILGYDAVLPDIARLISTGDCRLIDVAQVGAFEGSAELPPLDEIERDVRTALLQHSSATTGLKKGVALTFDAIAAQIGSYGRAIGAGPDDKVVSWLPLYHDMGLIAAFLLPVSLGASIVSIDAFDWLIKPAVFFELIETYRATLAWLPNFAFNHLLRTHDDERRYDLSSLRALISCSEPCKAATFEGFLEHFRSHGLSELALQTSYAMAEAVFAVTQSDVGHAPKALAVDGEILSRGNAAVPVLAEQSGAMRFLSCGPPIDGIEVRILAGESRQNHTRQPASVPVGEVVIRGSFVFHEYHRNPQDTVESFDDGWFKTGDVGFIHDGELYICGRTKEMLIVHGRNFYANDVESIVNAPFPVSSPVASPFSPSSTSRRQVKRQWC